MTLAPIDYIILALYFAFVLGIGWLVKGKVSTSEDFLTSGRSVPVIARLMASSICCGVVTATN